MTPAQFQFQSALAEINDSFTNRGWITLSKFVNDIPSELVYCGLVKTAYLEEYLQTDDWEMTLGSEGKPSIITTYRSGGIEKNTYHPFSNQNFEPFIFNKFFPHNKSRYIDISEDFVNYFKLYEEVEDKSNRKYYSINDMGEMTEVLVVDKDLVKVRYKFMMEYLSIRQIHLSICFDYMAITQGTLAEMGMVEKDQVISTDDRNYKQLAKVIPYETPKSLQHWIRGKIIIRYDQGKTEVTWLDNEEQYESFIVGVEKKGDPILKDCSRKEATLAVTFFKRTVLDKYYNAPEIYTVDGFSVSCSQFTLKIDNNCDGYVPVFLDHLSNLPYKEQVYWKQYNIEPDGYKISNTYHTVMIQGEFPGDPLMPDLLFKDKYEQFNENWLKKHNWSLFGQLSGIDVHLFSSLHLPSTDNAKSFAEQVLTLAKITIDSLNRKELTRELQKIDNEGSIAKLERYLELHGHQVPELFLFLRHLQNLRSGMIAHRNKTDDKKVGLALEYFGFKDKNYREVAKKIFSKATETINILDVIFLKN